MKEINRIITDDERILWEGTPNFWPFILGRSIAASLFGIIWLAFMIPFFIAAFLLIISGFAAGWAILLLPHTWIGIIFAFGIPIYNILLYSRTYYAITDKRVVIQSGVIGRDFQTIDFDQITNAEVNVGVLAKIFCSAAGSIRISTAATGAYTGRSNVAPIPFRLTSVNDPYGVYKFFKKVSYDVKTDIQYPNKLRPSTNPGYKSRLASKPSSAKQPVTRRARH